MNETQSLFVMAVSVVAVTCMLIAAYDVRSSNGRTARAFSNLLFCLAAGIVFVTIAEYMTLSSRIETLLIISGRLVKVAGVAYFMHHLRRKAKEARQDEHTTML